MKEPDESTLLVDVMRYSLAAKAMLRRVEWSGGNSQARRCPICGGREKPAKTYPTGHQPGCELQKMVGRA